MAKRGKFSAEYKREAVGLVKSSDQPISQVARDLGLNSNILSRWCRECGTVGDEAFAGQGKPRDEELVALRRELVQVRKELDFFKRSGDVLREGIEMKYRMIECCHEAFPFD